MKYHPNYGYDLLDISNHLEASIFSRSLARRICNLLNEGEICRKIYNAALASAPRWVSVKERLPEKEGWYVTTQPAFGIDLRRFDGIVIGSKYVTHWLDNLTPPEAK